MDPKSYRTYSNFLKSLSLKLTRFYYKKLDKNFVVYNKLKGKGYDPVTTSDKAFEKFIRKEIKKRFPTHQIIGEEFGKTKDKSDFAWIIDPIDGTINFLHGIPHFAISIALKYKNEIVSGIVFDPIKDEMFYAEKNNGAFFNNQRIRVSKKNKIEDCLFVTGNKIKIIPDLIYRKTGSAALDMAYVAAGRYDGYFQHDIKLWDIAAGIILVKEAGGIMSEIDLSNNYIKKIIVSSTDISEKLLKKLGNF